MRKGIYIHTLGCPKNQVDSDNLSRMLSSKGLAVTHNESKAGLQGIILVNTCGFIEDAKRESIEETLRLLSVKNKEAKIVVFGCLAQRYQSELEGELSEVDAFFGVGEEEKIIRFCVAHSDVQPAGTVENNTAGTTYTYLKIAEGCDKKCTYCVIPKIRGRFRSFPPDEILREAQYQVSLGKKELILVSQDLLNYGKGLNGYNIVSLLKDISSIKGDFRIRLLYLNPMSIKDDFIEVVATNDKICKYLDIPLQHSEDKILRLMGRTGSKKKHLAIIDKLRTRIPDVSLRTTMIVGFPGETEADFKDMKGFINEVRFEHLGAFKYSKEEGTKSAQLPHQVRESTMLKRLDELMLRQAEISLEKNQGLIGKTLRVLVDEPGFGRTDFQSPEIDGMVIIMNKEKARQGEFARVEITNALEYDLAGKITP